MLRPSRIGTLAVALAVFTVAGCCHGHKCSSYQPLTRGSQYLPCDTCTDNAAHGSRFVPAPPPGPPLGAPRVPQLPPGDHMPPGPPPPPPPGPRNNPPVGEPNVRLFPPERLPDGANAPPQPYDPNPPSVRLYPPGQTLEPPLAKVPNPPGVGPEKPKGNPEPTPALPADIPGFARVKPQVATGLQPFPEGVQWLSAQGYRAVLYVRAPGEDDSAAKKLFSGRGLRYVSLEVSPKTLTQAVVDQFNDVVADKGNLPLFVYDKDGALAGGLWYLHFRTAERLDDEKARQEAARLGFSPDSDGPHKNMWLAIQAYLRDRNP